jgi:hypothetical protein
MGCSTFYHVFYFVLAMRWYSYKIIDLSRDATDRVALYLVSSQVSDALLGIESEVVYVCTCADPCELDYRGRC